MVPNMCKSYIKPWFAEAVDGASGQVPKLLPSLGFCGGSAQENSRLMVIFTVRTAEIAAKKEHAIGGLPDFLGEQNVPSAFVFLKILVFNDEASWINSSLIEFVSVYDH